MEDIVARNQMNKQSKMRKAIDFPCHCLILCFLESEPVTIILDQVLHRGEMHRSVCRELKQYTQGKQISFSWALDLFYFTGSPGVEFEQCLYIVHVIFPRLCLVMPDL